MAKKTTKPKLKSITIRSYQVGFGDCFLLSFAYSDNNRSRHVLIDFGTTGTPRGVTKAEQVQRTVAQHIKAVCEGKLDAVVATHRHKDHISGFDTTGGEESSGRIIASLKPRLVIQPWTEDPKAAVNATAPTEASSKKNLNLNHVASLMAMRTVAQAALDRSKDLKGVVGKQLGFLGENNLSNKSAVTNLMTMAKNKYVYFGAKSGLESLLPGVQVHVIGPPTLEQSEAIRKQRSRDANEFWQLQAATLPRLGAGKKQLFPQAEKYTSVPPGHRWFTSRMDNLTQDSLLELVRVLDNAMNNTSVILVFEAGNKKLLFPGDAQIENWSYALFESKKHAEIRSILANVDFYKVGHHGSLNATPKTLWDLFENKSTKKSSARLKTNVSTMAGKHGSVDSGTEVPRRPLVEALKKESDFFSTQDLGFNKKIWNWKPEDGIEAAKFCHVETLTIK